MECSLDLLTCLLSLHRDSSSAAASPRCASSSRGRRLLLSAGLSRLLNLLSHAAERRFGLTKFHEACARLSLPGWIVQLRHDAAHGDLPDEGRLREGAEAALRWLRLNYWVAERRRLERGELSASFASNKSVPETRISVQKKVKGNGKEGGGQ